ncbi:hypothetical protein [Blastococcus saxobsidens]|uniref:hypothetical protein n=1 Tax=Blastococcus saxobsidens TaxID=138336 RepID=UPI0013152E43|nr:hypothetical protein [Blastococcus saxobsidens]
MPATPQPRLCFGMRLGLFHARRSLTHLAPCQRRATITGVSASAHATFMQVRGN